jgi:hypothetical protein
MTDNEKEAWKKLDHAMAALNEPISGLGSVTRRTVVVLGVLDASMRAILGMPPRHYNPSPMLGLREHWPAARPEA